MRRLTIPLFTASFLLLASAAMAAPRWSWRGSDVPRLARGLETTTAQLLRGAQDSGSRYDRQSYDPRRDGYRDGYRQAVPRDEYGRVVPNDRLRQGPADAYGYGSGGRYDGRYAPQVDGRTLARFQELYRQAAHFDDLVGRTRSERVLRPALENVLLAFYDAGHDLEHDDVPTYVRDDFERARVYMDALIDQFGGYRQFRNVRPGHAGWNRN